MTVGGLRAQAVTRGERTQQRTELPSRHGAEHRRHILGLDPSAAIGDCLIEDAESIAHTAARGPRVALTRLLSGHTFGLTRIAPV